MSYDYYNALMRGEKPNLYEGDFHDGFWLCKVFDGYAPANTWTDDFTDEWFFQCEGLTVRGDKALEKLSFCLKKPISEDEYNRLLETNNKKEIPVTIDFNNRQLGHNNPPDEYQMLKNEIEELKSLKLKANDEFSLTDLKVKSSNLKSQAEKIHKKLKEPHLEAGRLVDAEWLTKVKEAKEIADYASKELGAIQMKALREKQEKERLAKEAHEKALKEIEVLNPSLLDAIAPLKVEEVKIKSLSTNGKSVSLRLIDVLEIQSYEELFKHYIDDKRFKDSQLIIDLLSKLAKVDLTAGITVNGAILKQEGRAR